MRASNNVSILVIDQQLFKLEDARNLRRYFQLVDLITDANISRDRFLDSARDLCFVIAASPLVMEPRFARIGEACITSGLWEPDATAGVMPPNLDIESDGPVTLSSISWMYQIKKMRMARAATWAQLDQERRRARFMLDVSAALNASCDLAMHESNHLLLETAAKIEAERRPRDPEKELQEHPAWMYLNHQLQVENTLLIELLGVLNYNTRFLSRSVRQILVETALSATHWLPRQDDNPYVQHVQALLDSVVDVAFPESINAESLHLLLSTAGKILELRYSAGRHGSVIPDTDACIQKLQWTAMFLLYRALYWHSDHNKQLMIDDDLATRTFMNLLEYACYC